MKVVVRIGGSVVGSPLNASMMAFFVSDDYSSVLLSVIPNVNPTTNEGFELINEFCSTARVVIFRRHQ